MTNDNKYSYDHEDNSCRHTNESVMCEGLMYTLSHLGIGHNRVVRYIFANELYILLKYGPLELKRHRNNNNWWG